MCGYIKSVQGEEMVGDITVQTEFQLIIKKP